MNKWSKATIGLLTGATLLYRGNSCYSNFPCTPKFTDKQVCMFDLSYNKLPTSYQIIRENSVIDSDGNPVNYDQFEDYNFKGKLIYRTCGPNTKIGSSAPSCEDFYNW